jgi:hypothetical protein
MFVACCSAVAVVWLAVLPAVGRMEAIREYISRNEAAGVDPSAKFYSEMPAMCDVIDRVETAQRRDRAAFWSFQRGG